MEACPRCQLPLAATPQGEPRLACPSCGLVLEHVFLPGLTRVRRTVATFGASEGDAVCFNHALKRAQHECARCGRFLCALCAVELGGRHVCPDCVRVGIDKLDVGGVKLEKGRFLPGELALLLGAVSLLFSPLAVITGPAALVCAILAARARPGPIPARRLPPILGSILALIGMAISVAFYASF